MNFILNLVFLLIMPSVLATGPTCSSGRVQTYLERTMEDINEVDELMTILISVTYFKFNLQKSLVRVNVTDCKSPCKYNYTSKLDNYNDGYEEISVLMPPYALENYINDCFCNYGQ